MQNVHNACALARLKKNNDFCLCTRISTLSPSEKFLQAPIRENTKPSTWELVHQLNLTKSRSHVAQPLFCISYLGVCFELKLAEDHVMERVVRVIARGAGVVVQRAAVDRQNNLELRPIAELAGRWRQRSVGMVQCSQETVASLANVCEQRADFSWGKKARVNSALYPKCIINMISFWSADIRHCSFFVKFWKAQEKNINCWIRRTLEIDVYRKIKNPRSCKNDRMSLRRKYWLNGMVNY